MAGGTLDADRHTTTEGAMKTVMGWIDTIVAKLARRKVDRDEGRR